MSTERIRNPWIVALATVFALVFVLLAMGCAKAPDQEMSGAEATLQAAEGAEASTYAAAELEAAREAMDTVRAELTAQQEKLALFRNYDRTKALIEEARTVAQAARAAAVAGKDAARAAAQQALENARAEVQGAYDLLDALGQCPRRPKGFQADLDTLKASLDAVAAGVLGIEEAVAAERFSEAQDLAAGVTGSVAPIRGDMENAKAKIRC